MIGAQGSMQAGDSRAGGAASCRAKLDVWGQLQEKPHCLRPLALIGPKLAGGRVALLKAELVVGVGVGEHHPLVHWESAGGRKITYTQG